MYSTLDKYLDTVKGQVELSTRKKDDDFFPLFDSYDKTNKFKTGFYSTRPTLKRKVRDFFELYHSFASHLAQENLWKYFNKKFIDHTSWFVSKDKVDESR